MKKKLFIIFLSVVVLVSSLLIPCSAASITLQDLLQSSPDDPLTAVAYADSDDFDLPLRYTWYRDYFLITYEENLIDPFDSFQHLEILSHSQYVQTDVKAGDYILINGSFFLGNNTIPFSGDISGYTLRFSFILRNSLTGVYDYINADLSRNQWFISSTGYIVFRGSVSLEVPVGYDFLQGIKIDYYFGNDVPFNSRLYFQTNEEPLNFYVGPKDNAPIFVKPDSSGLDDFSSAEQEVLNKSKDGLSQAEQVMNSLNSIMAPGQSIYKGIMFLGNFMSYLTLEIPQLYDIVYVSLALGFLMAIVGGVTAVINSSKRSNNSGKNKGG